jgi:hypothetical protein
MFHDSRLGQYLVQSHAMGELGGRAATPLLLGWPTTAGLLIVCKRGRVLLESTQDWSSISIGNQNHRAREIGHG